MAFRRSELHESEAEVQEPNESSVVDEVDKAADKVLPTATIDDKSLTQPTQIPKRIPKRTDKKSPN